jgi:hypothetical protein
MVHGVHGSVQFSTGQLLARAGMPPSRGNVEAGKPPINLLSWRALHIAVVIVFEMTPTNQHCG